MFGQIEADHPVDFVIAEESDGFIKRSNLLRHAVVGAVADMQHVGRHGGIGADDLDQCRRVRVGIAEEAHGARTGSPATGEVSRESRSREGWPFGNAFMRRPRSDPVQGPWLGERGWDMGGRPASVFGSRQEFLLHLHQLLDLGEKPTVDLGELEDLLEENPARRAWRRKKIRSALGTLSLRLIRSRGRMSRSP